MLELARQAGVSKSTVSRALADNKLIAEETRRRIQTLAAQRGYRVNRAARALRSRVTHTVAVSIFLEHDPRQSVSDPFFLTMLGAIADALAEHQHNLVLSKVPSNASAWLEQTLRDHQVDGLVFIGQSLQHDALNQATTSGIPMVVWGALLDDQRYVTVGSDNAAGGYQATTHLIEQGSRHIAFLGNVKLPEIRQRFDGYKRALLEHGLMSTRQQRMAVHFDSDAAYAEVSRLLDSGMEIDGIVAASDVIAMSAIRALTDRGKRIPRDVAVTGFDDIALAGHTTPPLTTVRQDISRAGRLIVQKLMDQISGRPARSTLLPVELILRESSLRRPRRTRALRPN
jgi:DNA-binding LacI/PurR family transcriptional regulator